MRVELLQQVNGAYGRFTAGHIADVPEHVAAAWVADSVAKYALADNPDEDPPEVTPQPRRRTPPASRHPSSHDGPTWSSDGPGPD